jgi:hypothetical protein
MLKMNTKKKTIVEVEIKKDQQTDSLTVVENKNFLLLMGQKNLRFYRSATMTIFTISLYLFAIHE